MSAYHPRDVDGLVASLLATAPAILLTGPRAAGKTTTALQHAGDVLRLDRPEDAATVALDPDTVLRTARSPLLLDEWQQVPDVLWAVKRAVDHDDSPGRFILTGSVRAETDERSWPGTGRVVRVPIWPMTQREIAGAPGGRRLLADLVTRGGVDTLDGLATPVTTPDLPGYLAMALRGGLPPVVVGAAARYPERWLATYLDQIATRDAPGIEPGRDPARLRRYLGVMAEHTAGLPTTATVVEGAGLNERTARAYDSLFQALGILDVVPAWSTNRLKRLTQRSKRYLTDTGITAAALRVTSAQVLMRDPRLLGRLVDTFVMAQVRGEIAADEQPPQVYHLRDREGREIDILLDYGIEGVVAIEVKAGSAPRPQDAAHLTWLRESLGDRFVAGLVVHTGSRVHRFAPDIAAVPIASLWS
jgi:hypothetical protein